MDRSCQPQSARNYSRSTIHDPLTTNHYPLVSDVHLLHRQGRRGQDDGLVGLRAAPGREAATPARSCLLSTDPAHSLADVLQVKLSDVPKRLAHARTSRGRGRSIRKNKSRNSCRAEREEILALLNKGSLFTRDELEPLLDTSLPGMAEVAALLAIHQLAGSDYDEVVVDTAPMGHAIRLFEMPQHFARFLDVLETAASRDVVLARHFGGTGAAGAGAGPLGANG